MVHYVQTMHTKWFLRLWFIRCKLWTYLTPKLTMSPNGPKRDSIWHMSSRSSIGCIQIDFQCSMQTMLLPRIRISTISKLTKPSFHLSLFTQEYEIVRPKWFLRLWCIRGKLCTYLALKLTMSTNGPKQDSKQDSIWHTSSRSFIGCVQIDF